MWSAGNHAYDSEWMRHVRIKLCAGCPFAREDLIGHYDPKQRFTLARSVTAHKGWSPAKMHDDPQYPRSPWAVLIFLTKPPTANNMIETP